MAGKYQEHAIKPYALAMDFPDHQMYSQCRSTDRCTSRTAVDHYP